MKPKKDRIVLIPALITIGLVELKLFTDMFLIKKSYPLRLFEFMLSKISSIPFFGRYFYYLLFPFYIIIYRHTQSKLFPQTEEIVNKALKMLGGSV